MTLKIIPAIMSGGAGTRLWPLSTEDQPKQFHALMGPRTMFAETVARVSGKAGDISFTPPLALCGRKHAARVEAAFREAETQPAAIIIEPEARNTAAVAAAAAAFAQEMDASALVLLVPSDHLIANVTAFHDAVGCAADVAHERIATFGITPDRAATGYGYIKRGAGLGNGVFAIDAFKEKPDAQIAARYLADGGYSWNSGMFLFAPEVLLSEFGAHDAIRESAVASLGSAKRSGNHIELGDEYAAAARLPLDVAVMERTARAAVVPCDIGWADVGSWAEVWRLAPRDADGFAVLGAAASADFSKIVASGVAAKAIDGPDLVVIAARGGVLIAPRAMAQDREALKRAAEELHAT